MPVIRSPEQVVFEDLLAIYTADANKLGQGTTDVVVQEFEREGVDRQIPNLSMPRVVVSLQYVEQDTLAAGGRGTVVGAFRLQVHRDRAQSEADEIMQGIRLKYDQATVYRALVDTDWRPGPCLLTNTSSLVRETELMREYALPFAVTIVELASSEGETLPGRVARLTYTAGSGGAPIVLAGIVEQFAHTLGMAMVDITSDDAPDNDVFFPGAMDGGWQFRAPVTRATGATFGNPRIPDGVLATLVLFKGPGASGQSWTESVYVESMQHVGPQEGQQQVVYRLRRSGATTEAVGT